MFTLLHQIIEILTNRMREVPTRLDKEKMKEFSQLDARYEVREKGRGGGREGESGGREGGKERWGGGGGRNHCFCSRLVAVW